MHKRLKAFTLIELLVVIAIVGILSGFIFVSMNSAINASKDAKREADVAAIAKAIMAYSSSSGIYPVDTSCDIVATGGCSTLPTNLQNYLTTLPRDPNGVAYYRYASPDNGATCTVTATLSDGSTYTYTCGGGFSKSSSPFVGWLHKKTITYSVLSQDYQIKLSIPSGAGGCEGNCMADFSDLRFASSNGTVLNYWIESTTSPAIVWVKALNGSTSFNMYYGKTGVTTTANGDNTFEFFDHFDGSVMNTLKWSNNGKTTPSVGGSRIYNGSSAIVYEALSLQGFSYNTREIIYGNYRTSGYDASVIGYSPRLLGQAVLNWQGNSTQNTGKSSGIDYRWEIIRNNSTNSILNINNAYALTDSYNASTSNQIDFYSSNGSTSGFSVDYIFIGKYQSSEPTPIIGGESSN
jgi:general secretion pathway protein G